MFNILFYFIAFTLWVLPVFAASLPLLFLHDYGYLGIMAGMVAAPILYLLSFIILAGILSRN